MGQDMAPRRGYLNENFHLFYLKDADMNRIDWHYHSFHKILVFLAGHASYAIEGQSYALEPGDMVLVPKGCIHRPEVQPGLAYERFILYISPEYLSSISSRETELAACFRLATEKYSFCLRPDRDTALVHLLEALRQSQEPGFGRDLLERSLLTQLMVSINRNMEEHQLRYVTSAACDEKIVAILKYLNLHLTEPISIDDLAGQFYISKYYMMRRFKAETGYTIHGYLTEKRLLLARERILSGEALNLVCEHCGFGDYSTFSRAYKKQFGMSPNAPIPPEQQKLPIMPID